MTRYTLTFIVVVCASFVLRAQGTAHAPDAPIIKFDSTSYWFDTVYQGSIVDHEYHFTNTGKSPLIISNVCGSSGSVCPSFPKEPIAPGKSAMIRVVFNTSGKMGPQDKTVTVTSNASQPTAVLHIRGVVTTAPKITYTESSPARIRFDTTSYDFGTVPQGSAVEHRFNFVNTGTAPLVIYSASFSGGGFTTDYPGEPIAHGDSGIIVVRFNTIGKSGAQEKICMIKTNTIDGYSTLNIKVFVKPQDPAPINH